MTAARVVISIVAPFYNERESVAAFFDRLLEVLDGLGLGFEIVCVNDGSRDETLSLLRRQQSRRSELRIIDLSRNFGKEAALTAGIDAARGDAVIPIDTDLQDPPELIPQLILKWREGYPVVLAQRGDRSRDTLLKRGSASLFYRLHNRLSKVAIPANVGDFRLLDRSVIEVLKRLPERERFMKGLFAWVGFRSAIVPYDRHSRQGGRTKWNYWRLWNLALDGISSFSSAPLRVWTYVGIIAAGAAFVFGFYLLMLALISGIDVPGYASLMLTVIFFGGIQLISLGVLGEYVGRIYSEVKQRPVYVIAGRYEPEQPESPAVSDD